MKSHFFHLILAFFVAVAVLVCHGFWYSIVAEKSAKVANLKEQIAVKTETASRIASARAALAEISDDEKTLQEYFVPETGVVAFIGEIESQGRELGSEVSVLSVSTDTIDKQPAFIFSLNIKGTFDSVMRTVGVIEYAPYNLSISKISIIKDDKDSWNTNLDLVVGSVSVATSTANKI